MLETVVALALHYRDRRISADSRTQAYQPMTSVDDPLRKSEVKFLGFCRPFDFG